MAKRRLNNWLEAYGEYTSGTEPPAHFNLWVGLGTIAGAAQRKIFFEHEYFRTYSNMYVVLVSEPGTGRKSTALRLGKNILKGIVEYGEEINFTTQASSVAAMVSTMAKIQNREHQSVTTFSSELGSLLGSNSVEMVDFLTDIWDCEPDWDKQTISRGLEKIPFPWLNLLAGTTPQWLGDNLPKTAVDGGFVARTIFVYGDSNKLVAWPQLTDRQRELRRDLMHDLALIARLRGVFTATPAARKFYQDWYEDPRRIKQEADFRIKSYYTRKPVHVLKTAMAIALSESDDLVLDTRHIQAALLLLEQIEPDMSKAFISVGRNLYSTDLERIRDQIYRSGGMSYGEIIAANIHSVPKDKLDELLSSLIDAGWVKREKGAMFVPTGK